MLIVAVGIIMLLIAGSIGLQRYQFIASARRAAGLVVETPFGGSHPTIEFRTVDGETVRYPQGGLIFGFKTGDPVQVLYDPNDPRGAACIETFGALWGFCALFSLMGLVLIAISIF